MKTKYFILNDSCDWKKIEKICVVFPYIRVSIFPHTFVIKPVYLCNLTTFVISPQNCDSIRESNFQQS